MQCHAMSCPHRSTNDSCTACGTICCFADDTTFSSFAKNPDHLASNLAEKFKMISEFLISNGLKLNEDKTHLLLLTSSQKRRKNNPQISLVTNSAIVRSTPAEKLLGCTIHEDLKWSEYILIGENSLVKSLCSRLKALKLVCGVASFKARKMIGEGIFMSKLIYVIQVWGGCELYLINVLQTLQNKAARNITKLPWNTTTRHLLLQCGWLSVKQLVIFHSVVFIHKTLKSKSPKYIYDMYDMHYSAEHMTRLAKKDLIRLKDSTVPKSDQLTRSFKWRATKQYNDLLVEIRNICEVDRFRHSVKKWISDNVPVV